MSMISFLFFGFVALVFAALYIVGRIEKDLEKSNSVSKWILLFASYLFVSCADWRFAVTLAAMSVSTWYFARRKKGSLVGVAIALAALAFFKYTNFFVGAFTSFFGSDDISINIILPLGISFYSFSAIGYLLDVRRGKVAARGLRDVALYLSFFPKITSGPIQKSGDFFADMQNYRSVGWHSFEPGIQIFAFGLFKKIVLADHLGVFVNQVYDTPLAFGSWTVFLAVVAYSLQIYFDFSGYSDMAIGVARILGVQLPRNFNLPYLAHNVTEFWKRWHITLSAWLQENLYISLGGNRRGIVRTYINLILTMVLGGIWHGANWTYVLWGLLHGVALAVHKMWMTWTGSDQKRSSALGSIISVIITYLFVSFCWIFFRANTIADAFVIIGRIFSFERGVEQPYLWLFVTLVLSCISVLAAFRKSGKTVTARKKQNVSMADGYYPLVDLTSFWGLVWFFVFCGLILCLAYTGGSPFIYGNY